MATRYYLPSTSTPGISPAFDSTPWPVQTNSDRRNMVGTRISSAMTNKDGAGDAATTNQLLRQYISSEQLAAQTISGTIKGVMRATSTTGNLGVGWLAVRVAKCASDGSGVTEIMSRQQSTRTTTQPPGMSAALTNRRLEQGNADFVLELTSTAVNEGDFLIVEIGYKDDSTNTDRAVRVSFGDDSATDLPENETATVADNPWVEFSMDIVFAGGAPADAVIHQAAYRGVELQ